VVAGVVQQLLQQAADHGARLAFHHGGMKVVDRVEQDRMLIVDGFDPDGECVIPNYERHANSPYAILRQGIIGQEDTLFEWNSVGARFALVDSPLIQPGAVELVGAFEVFQVAVAHPAKQRVHGNIFAVLDAMGRLPQIGQQPLMRQTVRGQAGETGLLQQLLLALEVHGGKLDKPVEQFTQLFFSATAHGGKAKLIHGIHQDAMLVVHGSDTNGAGMIPG
jgi:hypothetical protein